MDSVTLCLDSDVPMMFVTEDTTRANPKDIKELYLTAVQAGATAICVADTVGHAEPKGVHRLVRYVRQFLNDEGYRDVRIDWHGHRDRGLSVANSIAAIEAGANRIHGTALGIGERCGNTPMDQLLVNLKLKGWIDNDLSVLAEYVELTSELVDIPIPINYPVIGKDAFRTATGVHAAAIMKAEKMGLSWANTVYSSVPATMVGKSQVIDIGPLSGMSNVVHKLNFMGIEASQDQADQLLEHAKNLGRILSDSDIIEFFDHVQVSPLN
ncbi:MAG: 2-isopropylmalate synthase [Candidatus Kariarchaeaceae archaeon]